MYGCFCVQVQRKPEEGAVELQDILSEARSPAGAQHFYNQPSMAAPATHLSPCCQSPCLQSHPQSTPSTPCPAISPAPPLPPKSAEPQGQPPHDYPQSLEPGKPPQYHLMPEKTHLPTPFIYLPYSAQLPLVWIMMICLKGAVKHWKSAPAFACIVCKAVGMHDTT